MEKTSDDTVKDDTVKEAANKGFNALEDKVLDGLDAARKVAENAVENTSDVQKKAEKTMHTIAEQVSSYAQEKPLQAAGMAFAAGVLATLLLSRRS